MFSFISRLSLSGRSQFYRASLRYLTESATSPSSTTPSLSNQDTDDDNSFIEERIKEVSSSYPGLGGQYAKQLLTDTLNLTENDQEIIRTQAERLLKAINIDYDIRLHVDSAQPDSLPVHPVLQRAIAELQTTRKTKHLPITLELFEQMYQDVFGYVSVEYTLANEPAAGDTQTIDKLINLANNLLREDLQVEKATFKVDPSLIHGFVLRVGENELDLSLRSKVDQFFAERRRLIEEQGMRNLRLLDDHFQEELKKVRPPTQEMIDAKFEEVRQQWGL